MNESLAWDERLRSELKNIAQEFTNLGHIDDVFWQVQAIIARSGFITSSE